MQPVDCVTTLTELGHAADAPDEEPMPQLAVGAPIPSSHGMERSSEPRHLEGVRPDAASPGRPVETASAPRPDPRPDLLVAPQVGPALLKDRKVVDIAEAAPRHRGSTKA